MYSDDIFILKYMGRLKHTIDEVSYVIDTLLIHHLTNQFIRSIENVSNVSNDISVECSRCVQNICKCQINAENNIILLSVIVLYSIV